MTSLPISVLLPTCNSSALVPTHLKSLREWVDLVEEIVVVDSFSDDGTLDLLKKHLTRPNVRFLDHPRGLYQSWNFGIQQLRAKYGYISTIGDTITAEGLRHLAATADGLNADVVISRPEFVNPDGTQAAGRRWPIHNLLQWRPTDVPIRIEPWHVFLLATLDVPEGILGSSASNLYRTQVLKKYPFPTDFGHAGDTAWGIRHAFHVLLAVTPEIFSRFMLHPPTAKIEGDQKKTLAARMFDLARETVKELGEQPAAEPIPRNALPLLHELPAELQKLREVQDRYDKARHQPWPWVFNPSAWQARSARNHQRAVLRQTKARICRAFGFAAEERLWTTSDT